MKIYVASSWRNQAQPTIVRVLRHQGHDVYDFRNPPNGSGFGWAQLGCGDPKDWGEAAYLQALDNSLAREGFKSDMDALKDCDACVLVRPCGASSHMELGWAVGAGKLTAVLLCNDPSAELMILMADRIFADLSAMIEWLEETPIPCRAGRGWGSCRCRRCEADRRVDP